jgi:hypothetical protein
VNGVVRDSSPAEIAATEEVRITRLTFAVRDAVRTRSVLDVFSMEWSEGV